MRRICLLLILLISLTFTSFTPNYGGCVNPYTCWGFADEFAQENENYNLASNSYADDYDIWVWYYDYCMDGLWAPATIVGCDK